MAVEHPSVIVRTWQRMGPSSRLAVGALLMVAVWWFGLRGASLFGIAPPWPMVTLCAAVGWGRVGLAIRPMLDLVVLGLLQDVSAAAPFGSYAIVGLATYGFHAAVGSAVDFDRDPILSSVRPFVSLGVGMALLWFVASNAAGYPVCSRPCWPRGLQPRWPIWCCARCLTSVTGPSRQVGDCSHGTQDAAYRFSEPRAELLHTIVRGACW